MKNSKIISFIATKLPKKARKFYEETLGLKFVSEDAFAIVFEVGAEVEASNRVASSQGTVAGMGSGIMLRVQKVEDFTPARHTVLGWEVADIVAEVKRLSGSRAMLRDAASAAKGVKFEIFPGMGQDDSGIWRSPSGARIAWFKDPDGNILSLTQFK
jgi:predicted enzyme related to lactoylglutathione lyase